MESITLEKTLYSFEYFEIDRIYCTIYCTISTGVGVLGIDFNGGYSKLLFLKYILACFL